MAGKKIVCVDFLIKWKKREGVAKDSRICVVVRKKDVKAASRRNRLRRLVKEFFRLNAGKFLFPIDAVVQPKNYREIKYKEIEDLLTVQMKQVGIIS